MALNVRFMQKAGVDPAGAVTGVGLNTFVGAVVHIVLLVVFFAWAGRDGTAAFSIPAEQQGARRHRGRARCRRGVRRHPARPQARPHARRRASEAVVASMKALAHSPSELAALFGGSVAVTLAYIGALAAAVAAFDGGVSFAEVGAVYLGASLIAAAAPTPGGLGALEAALVAGFTGVGMDSGVAVAAVLSYRLVTYWLPDPAGLARLPRARAPELDLARMRSQLVDRETLAAEAEGPPRQRAGEQPEAGTADDVERQMGAGVDAGDARPAAATSQTTGRQRLGTDGASTAAKAKATAEWPDT